MDSRQLLTQVHRKKIFLLRLKALRKAQLLVYQLQLFYIQMFIRLFQAHDFRFFCRILKHGPIILCKILLIQLFPQFGSFCPDRHFTCACYRLRDFFFLPILFSVSAQIAKHLRRIIHKCLGRQKI